MSEDKLKQLFEKYLKGELTPEEESLLMLKLVDDSNKHKIDELILESQQHHYGSLKLDTRAANKMYGSILSQGNEKRILKVPFYKKITFWSAAAVIALLIGITFLLRQEKETVRVTNKVIAITPHFNKEKPLYENDVQPGGNYATLTLSDGSKIILDNADEGVISRQGKTRIIKLADGQISYNTKLLYSGKIAWNTISTPRGGKYQVVLSDGTSVWLNASSSLKFPVVFAQNERRVEITGEAYFEVAENKEKPFYVEAGTQEIKVLGTHFNVMAYTEEKAIITTLLEGSVRVSTEETTEADESSTVTLEPGQQSTYTLNEISVSEVETYEAIAWKDGLFVFNNESIESIMSQLVRWYNIEVNFTIDPTKYNFTGVISKSGNVSEVLKMLELTDEVHFRIEGRRVTVLP